MAPYPTDARGQVCAAATRFKRGVSRRAKIAICVGVGLAACAMLLVYAFLAWVYIYDVPVGS
jgi:hypothetical protein